MSASTETVSSSGKPNRFLAYLPLVSIVIAACSLGWTMWINSNQVQLQSQQADFAKIQAENSTKQEKLAQDQAVLKKIQDEHNQILHGISIHPVRYKIDLKIDESDRLLPGQSIEIINGSERIATEISAFWEIVGTDYGNPKGWGSTEQIEFDRQTLRPLEQMAINAMPSQLSIIASPNNESKAIEYYGYLRIVFSDSRLKQTTGNSYRMTVRHDKQKRVLLLEFTVDHNVEWMQHYLDNKNPAFEIFEPR